jgi:hypothetical protein
VSLLTRVEVLGHADSKPRGEVIVLPSGERLPISLGFDEYAFDVAVAREGWVGIRLDVHGVSIVDGDPLDRRPLPDATVLAPAADRALLVIRRYLARGAQEAPQTLDLVDSSGSVVRSVTAKIDGVAGELRVGVVVAWDALVSWDGAVAPLPAEGEATAVLDGRCILLFDRRRDRVRLLDAETGRTVATSILPPLFDSYPVYNMPATAVAFHGWGRDILIADSEGVLEWLRVDFDVHSAVWMSDTDLLLVGDDGHCSINVLSGERGLVAGFPRRAYPRVVVTGRYDLDALRGA